MARLTQKDANRIRVGICLLLLAVLQVVLFHDIWTPDLLFGDRGDGRFNNCVCESWYRFFSGQTAFNDLQSFYPMTNSLAWSDMLLGFALPYSLLRALGVGMLAANKIVLDLFFLVGLFSMFWLLHRGFRFSLKSSLLGAGLTFCSCTFASLSNHTQMLFMAWIPVTTALIVFFLQNCGPDGSRKKRIWAGSLAVVSIGLEFWTAFYVGYFHFLLLAAVAVMWVIQAFFTQRGWGKVFCQSVARIWKELFLYFACLLVWFVPLVKLYLPVLRQFGGRGAKEILLYSPYPYEILSTVRSGGVLARLEDQMYRSLSGDMLATNGEFGYGLSLVVLALFAAAFVYLLVRFFVCLLKKQPYPLFAQVGLACGASAIVLYLTIISNGTESLWIHLYRFIPGATAIRAIARLIAFLILPVGIAIAGAFEDASRLLLRKNKKAAAPLVAFALLVLLVFAAFESPYFYLRWSAREQQAELDAVAETPADCQCFFMYFGEEAGQPMPMVNVGGWILAQTRGLYTLNGYSGQFPDGWSMIGLESDYLNGVKNWVEANRIDTSTLYAYDMDNNVWIPYGQLMAENQP